MNVRNLLQSAVSWCRRRPVLAALAGLGAVAVLAALLWSTSRPAPQESSYYEAQRGDFLISIVEGGTLQAVNEEVIRNEVEGTSRIIFIVPEGSNVKKGDLLVELDSSASVEAVNQQQISVEKAQFGVIQADQQLDIQKSMVDSEVKAAQLKVEFAESDLKKYAEGEALQLRRNAQIDITNVLESLEIAKDRLVWSEKLYKDGFETKGNLDKDRLTFSQTELKLEQTRKDLELLEIFDIPKKQRALEAALQEAKENLDRVKLQGDRRMAQFTADLDTQRRTLELSQAKLERDKKQLQATKIYAPQDGLVVYGSAEGGGHFSSESMIEEGAVVRFRQELIKLPDVSEYKVKVKIHESHINQVQRGQPAFVVLDPMPDQRFRGVVSKVAPLPDSQSRWGNPDLKVYATEVVLLDKVLDVKPGVSARAEIVITNMTDVLTVPIQAVTTRKGKPAVFLADSPQEPKLVTVGMYNSKFIEVSAGLKEGDRVLLSPPFDTKEKDLAGAIIAQGEAPPKGVTNLPPLRMENGENGRRGAPGPDDERALARGEGRPPAGLGDPPNGDDSQRDGMRRGKRGRAGGEFFQGSLTNREELVKRFDLNGDGRLDESELAAMRDSFGRGGSRTNAPDPARAN